MNRRSRETATAYGYLIPALVAITVVTVVPAIYNIFISLTNYGLFHYFDYGFIGLANYREIFTMKSPFFPVLGWTFTWTFLSAILNVGAGLGIAMLLNHPGLKERNLYRALLIIPWALPGVLSIQMWHTILGSDGLLNQLIQLVGLQPVAWLSSAGMARFSVLWVNVWLSFPYFMVVSQAGLKSIPTEVYEAATTDGATRFQCFRYITIPLLRRILMPVLITQITFQFNNFNLIYLLTGGGPRESLGQYYGATDILVSYTFNLMREVQRYGLTAAYGVITFVMTIVLLLVSMKVTKSLKEGW